MGDVLSLLERSFDFADKRIAGIGATPWTAKTPCSEWVLRQLVNHLIGIPVVLARTAAGERLTPEEFSPDVMAEIDRVGEDPRTSFDAEAAAALSVCAQPGALAGVCVMARGEVPTAVLAKLAASDCLVHSWDVARATGQDAAIPTDLAEFALEFMRSFVSPNARGAQFSHFAPPVAVGDDASATDRLVAFLGRQP